MTTNSLLAILQEKSTIRFLPESTKANLTGIDLLKNPQRAPDGAYSWYLADRKSEVPITFVGKLIYSGFGNKTGPYFSIPDQIYIGEIDTTEMAKAKLGFTIRLINNEVEADADLPEQLVEHHQAMLEFTWAIQEAADGRMQSTGQSEMPLEVKAFAKQEEGLPFYTVPVVSAPLFPQFKGSKGVKAVGVTRPKLQAGRMSLNPAKANVAPSDGKNSSRITFGNLPDLSGRYEPLKQQEIYNSYEMVWPPVFDAAGKHVRPGNYEDSIPDGTLVKISGNMKMYNIVNKKKSTLSRPYMVLFDRIQVISDLMDQPTNPLKRSLELDDLTETGTSSNRKASELEYMTE